MKDMELEDIQKAQEELVEEAHEYFEGWREREEVFRQEFTSQFDRED
ncbi:hypothetical protein LCGC14_1115580 [marine sediment metagenome]|uniref:Uncharacterized protein n=1 Tax=marine sediment metagenome TaxID=412755 RepID=A0A0F9QB96_9ZZZZ